MSAALWRGGALRTLISGASPNAGSLQNRNGFFSMSLVSDLGSDIHNFLSGQDLQQEVAVHRLQDLLWQSFNRPSVLPSETAANDPVQQHNSANLSLSGLSMLVGDLSTASIRSWLIKEAEHKKQCYYPSTPHTTCEVHMTPTPHLQNQYHTASPSKSGGILHSRTMREVEDQGRSASTDISEKANKSQDSCQSSSSPDINRRSTELAGVDAPPVDELRTLRGIWKRRKPRPGRRRAAEQTRESQPDSVHKDTGPQESGRWSLMSMESASQVMQACEARHSTGDLHIGFIATALFRCAQLVGVKRSVVEVPANFEPLKKLDSRQKMLQSSIFQDIIDVIVTEKTYAQVSVLISLIWSFGSLRLTGHSETTPEVIKVLAKELESRSGELDDIVPHQLTHAVWSLSNSMRKDAPWDDLLLALAEALVNNREDVLSGPAGVMLKSVAAYKVVHGSHPIPDNYLSFFTNCLNLADPHSPGPQAITQGLHALAKLQFNPGAPFLSNLLAEVLARLGSDSTSQAVTNVFWSLAALDFPMTDVEYRKIMHTLDVYRPRFRHIHYAQVFAAILKYNFSISYEQMDLHGRHIIKFMPKLIWEQQLSQWQTLLKHMRELENRCNRNGQEVPDSWRYAIKGIKSLDEHPRLRQQARRTVLSKLKQRDLSGNKS